MVLNKKNFFFLQPSMNGLCGGLMLNIPTKTDLLQSHEFLYTLSQTFSGFESDRGNRNNCDNKDFGSLKQLRRIEQTKDDGKKPFVVAATLPAVHNAIFDRKPGKHGGCRVVSTILFDHVGQVNATEIRSLSPPRYTVKQK